MASQKFTNPPKVTIYTSGFLGVAKVEGHLHEVGTKKYAQYDVAPFCVYRKKRARKLRGMVATFRPYLVVVEGWGHPDLHIWGEAETSGGVTTQTARFSGCDERWEQSFDIFLADYVGDTGVKLLADYRYTQGVDAHDRFKLEQKEKTHEP